MSRLQSILINCCGKEVEFPPLSDEVLTFISLTDQDTFEKYRANVHQPTGYLIGDTHSKNIARMLGTAYVMRIQYVKVMYGLGQLVFLKPEKPLVRVHDGSWGVSMNDVRKRIKPMIDGGKLDAAESQGLFFDERYTGYGIIYDLAHLLSQEVTALPEMDLNDLTIYIARWGGLPGAEKFRTPYGL